MTISFVKLDRYIDYVLLNLGAIVLRRSTLWLRDREEAPALAPSFIQFLALRRSSPKDPRDCWRWRTNVALDVKKTPASAFVHVA